MEMKCYYLILWGVFCLSSVWYTPIMESFKISKKCRKSFEENLNGFSTLISRDEMLLSSCWGGEGENIWFVTRCGLLRLWSS